MKGCLRSKRLLPAVVEFPTSGSLPAQRKGALEALHWGVPAVAQGVTNPTSIYEDVGSIPVALSCDVGHRHGLDPMLLWLWCRPAAAALI